MARPGKCRSICSMPAVTEFMPAVENSLEPVVLGVDALEVIRILDYRRLTQAECARRMNVSRTTVTRIYDDARRRLARALIEGRRLVIEGGDVMICEKPRPECADEPYCCHRQKGEE